MSQIKIFNSWLSHLENEFEKDYMRKLRSFLKEQYQAKKIIYPSQENYFAALNSTDFADVKVVIVGQDPYHGPGQAHGLCFSVPEGVRIPPSLQNIFQELKNDLQLPIPTSGNLHKWTQQGVLLLNSVLTVEAGLAGSHQNKGWEIFTDKIISLLNEKKKNLVFVLWGAYAQKKAQYVDRSQHLVLESVHPSPLSAHRGFFGTQPFSKINEYLLKNKQKPIDWSLESL